MGARPARFVCECQRDTLCPRLLLRQPVVVCRQFPSRIMSCSATLCVGAHLSCRHTCIGIHGVLCCDPVDTHTRATVVLPYTPPAKPACSKPHTTAPPPPTSGRIPGHTVQANHTQWSRPHHTPAQQAQTWRLVLPTNACQARTSRCQPGWHLITPKQLAHGNSPPSCQTNTNITAAPD